MKENAGTDGDVSENIDGEPRDGAFRAWIRAYKNIFNFKGRTSRYEFWSAMLVNMAALFLLILGISYMAFGLVFVTSKVSVILTVLAVVFSIAEVFFYLSLFVRRLHDAGYGAWKGFFRPMIVCWLLTSVVSIAGVVIYNNPSFTSIMMQNFTTLALGAVMLLGTMLYAYYNLKIFIAVGFFEEENKANQYGAPAFCDAGHKTKTLRFASFYLLFIFVFYYLAQLISMWLAIADNSDSVW